MVNREQIIEMAQQAGMREPQPLSQDSERWYPRDFAERFFALAYAAGQRDMREKAAAVCKTIRAVQNDGCDDGWEFGIEHGAKHCADAIHALPIGEQHADS